MVRKGQPLLEIYSPELVAAQQEYLLALDNGRRLAESPFPEVAEGARRLLDAARTRLAYWDISEKQISELERTRQLRKTLTLYSPFGGIYGRWNDWIGSKREPLLGFTAVFRVPHEGGEAELVTEPGEFEQPNGLCFSPDESLMYVNDSPRAHVKVFEVADDGRLVNGRVLAEGIGGTIEGGSPDGMECDEHGNVWTTGPGGVWVLDSGSGERIGLIETPEVCGSLCWGGPDLRTLFLTTSTTLHAIPTRCTSAPLPHY
jgi:hypothetical protein